MFVENVVLTQISATEAATAAVAVVVDSLTDVMVTNFSV